MNPQNASLVHAAQSLFKKYWTDVAHLNNHLSPPIFLSQNSPSWQTTETYITQCKIRVLHKSCMFWYDHKTVDNLSKT